MRALFFECWSVWAMVCAITNSSAIVAWSCAYQVSQEYESKVEGRQDVARYYAPEDEEQPSRDRVYIDTQDAGLSYSGYGGGNSFHHHQPEFVDSGDYRQPMAIVVIRDDLAIIPTRKSGEIFGLNLQTLECKSLFQDRAREWGKAVRLAEDAFAVIDRAGECVVVFRAAGNGWTIVSSMDCPGLPKQLAWVADEGRLYVSGQWAQRLYRFQAKSSSTPFSEFDALPPTDLPICAGAILPLPKQSALLVMDAFSRDLVVLNRDGSEIRKHDQLYDHNIPGLVAVDDGERVMYVQQLLNEFAQSTRGDITWGGLLSNNIRWLLTERVIDPNIRGSEMFSKSKFYPVGKTGDGAGDPTSICLSSDGQLAVTIGGTSRVAFGRLDDLDLRQVDTGLHPVDGCFTPDNQQLIVVNQFTDSLTVVATKDRSVQHLQLGPLRSPTAVERGEQFFFDSRFSHDGWMSCHSCHSEGHTSGQANDNLTDGTFGSPKRILSLLGQADTSPYSWSGKFEKLEEQIFHSLRSTMATDEAISQEVVDDLAAYVRSLPAPPSLVKSRQPSNVETSNAESSMLAGKDLFTSLGCVQCHAGPLFTSPDIYHVDLVDEQGMNEFNPPSLIGVSQRHALLHDGRAQTLREVIEGERHQLDRDLHGDEVEALIGYLQSL